MGVPFCLLLFYRSSISCWAQLLWPLELFVRDSRNLSAQLKSVWVVGGGLQTACAHLWWNESSYRLWLRYWSRDGSGGGRVKEIRDVGAGYRISSWKIPYSVIFFFYLMCDYQAFIQARIVVKDSGSMVKCIRLQWKRGQRHKCGVHLQCPFVHRPWPCDSFAWCVPLLKRERKKICDQSGPNPDDFVLH